MPWHREKQVIFCSLSVIGGLLRSLQMGENTMKRIIGVCGVGLMLMLCSCNYQMNRAQSGAAMGAAGGAVLGQVIGGNTEATLIGAAVGGLLGYVVGNEMDKYDRQQLNSVYEQGPSGQPSSWVNPDSGNSYSVTPSPATTGANGPCRNAQIEAVIDGRRELTNARACRDYNGQWVLQ